MIPPLFRMFGYAFLFCLGELCFVEDICQLLGSRFQVFFGRDVQGVEGESAVGDGFDEVLFFFTVFAYGPERIVYVCLVDAYFDNKGDMI